MSNNSALRLRSTIWQLLASICRSVWPQLPQTRASARRRYRPGLELLEGRITPSGLIDSDSAADLVDENAANNTTVGLTAFWDEPNASTPLFSIINDTSGGAFQVNPSSGQVTVANSNLLDYPSGGNYSVTVQATDSILTDQVTFEISVNPVNDAPILTASDPAAVDEDADPVTIANWASFSASGGSDESSQSVVAYVVSNISNPSLFAVAPSVATNGTLTYTLADDANGTSTFDVTVQDDGGTDNGGIDTSAAQTFTITVNAVNDAPTAMYDEVTTNEDTTVNVYVLGNDTDADGDPLTISIATGGQPSSGNVQIDDNDTPANPSDDFIIYAPNSDFSGLDSFIYQIHDGTDYATALVVVVVNWINEAPVAVNDTYALDASDNDSLIVTTGVLGNDTDPDDPKAIYAILVSDPANGIISLNSSGGFVYTPNSGFRGSDSFEYKINDHLLDSNTATVTITVSGSLIDLDGRDAYEASYWLGEDEEDDPGIFVDTSSSSYQAKLLVHATGESSYLRKIIWDTDYFDITGGNEVSPGVIEIDESEGDVELTVISTGVDLPAEGLQIAMLVIDQSTNQDAGSDSVTVAQGRVIWDVQGVDPRIRGTLPGARIHINDNFTEGQTDTDGNMISDNLIDPATLAHGIVPADADLQTARFVIGPAGRQGTLSFTVNNNVKLWWQPGANWVPVPAVVENYMTTNMPVTILVEGITLGTGSVTVSFTPNNNQFATQRDSFSFTVYTGLTILGPQAAALEQLIENVGGYTLERNAAGEVWRSSAIANAPAFKGRFRQQITPIFENRNFDRRNGVTTINTNASTRTIFDSLPIETIDVDDYAAVYAFAGPGSLVAAGLVAHSLVEFYRNQIFGEPYLNNPAQDDYSGGAHTQGLQAENAVIGWGNRSAPTRNGLMVSWQYGAGAGAAVFRFTIQRDPQTSIIDVAITPPAN